MEKKTKVKRQNKTVVIKFNKNFYNLKAIKVTAQAFQGLADLEISSGKKEVRVKLKNIHPQVREVIREEFCNYVLAMMKE